MVISSGFWVGRRVFLTGHTGFKGGWLALWLRSLGAEVHGFALAPPTSPNFFSLARVAGGLAASHIADIRDAHALSAAIRAAQPELVFHLAAQPLVRQSYLVPVDSYSTNVMGTVNLLEAVRGTPGIRAVVNITTDKCYENQEWIWGYRESDPMGGHDPYSSSKACAELVTAAYRRSFLAAQGVSVASARAGNVIGGGDWAADRLIPDVLRAFATRETVPIRNPGAIRPWQHVLEPLSGYLMLAEKLITQGTDFASGWNFGPEDRDARTVEWIVSHVAALWGDGAEWLSDTVPHPHEAHCLKLDISKAHGELDWQPRWNLETALVRTIEWHKAWLAGDDMRDVSLKQIADYVASAAK